jgi:glycerol-3-phosphate acyltransferase PlsY
VIGAVLIIYKHSNNIQRLRAGTESKFTFEVRKP